MESNIEEAENNKSKNQEDHVDQQPLIALKIGNIRTSEMVDSGCSHVLMNSKKLEEIRINSPNAIKGEIKCGSPDSHFAGKNKARATGYVELAIKFDDIENSPEGEISWTISA